ncbi:RNA-binding protein 1-like [Euphorbia lathyris]|uniref:RNA-binding protein 1-like n=1 Tax=Euphorbia lathyris TaxID=212925 RepID=UPI0033133531
MDIDNAKLFVGGISRDTTEDVLRTHFSKYGTVLGSLVAKEKFTRNPRGFGFVWFSDPTYADKALGDSHLILGRMVEVKKAIPKSEQLQIHQHQQQISNQQNSNFGDNSNTGNGNSYFRTKKIFVGGLSSSLTEEQFKNYFVRFGNILDVVVMQDSSTNRPRGFGFVTFDSEESVDKVMLNTFHELNGRLVEVKRAVPKEGMNGANSSCITKGVIRGPLASTMTSHHENYFPYGHGYEILPGLVPFPGYNGVGWYSYGTGIYGGYPMVGYGRPDNRVTTFAPRSPWSSPVMTVMCTSPYNNPFIYPTYLNGDVSIMGMMPSGHSGIVGPTENEKLKENSGVYGCQEYDGTRIPIEGVKSRTDSVEE